MRISLTVYHHAGGHSHSLLALTDNGRLWGHCRCVSLCYRKSNRILDTATTLLFKNNLDMCGLGNVKEVLGVSAPNVVT